MPWRASLTWQPRIVVLVMFTVYVIFKCHIWFTPCLLACCRGCCCMALCLDGRRCLEMSSSSTSRQPRMEIPWATWCPSAWDWNFGSILGSPTSGTHVWEPRTCSRCLANGPLLSQWKRPVPLNQIFWTLFCIVSEAFCSAFCLWHCTGRCGTSPEHTVWCQRGCSGQSTGWSESSTQDACRHDLLCHEWRLYLICFFLMVAKFWFSLGSTCISLA